MPLDVPHPEYVYGHLALFELFDIPSSFISERLQSVTHSFGFKKGRDGSDGKARRYTHKQSELTCDSSIMVSFFVQEYKCAERR